jgi:actin-related protein 10
MGWWFVSRVCGYTISIWTSCSRQERALKTGGSEVTREKWDEANANQDPEESMDLTADFEDRRVRNILPDWTKTPLPIGAPPANINRMPSQAEVEVGA